MGKKQRYELKELGNGTFAYALKSGMPDSEPEHSIRAGCCTTKRRSRFFSQKRSPGRTLVYCCHECGSELIKSGAGDMATARRAYGKMSDRKR